MSLQALSFSYATNTFWYVDVGFYFWFVHLGDKFFFASQILLMFRKMATLSFAFTPVHSIDSFSYHIFALSLSDWILVTFIFNIEILTSHFFVLILSYSHRRGRLKESITHTTKKERWKYYNSQIWCHYLILINSHSCI